MASANFFSFTTIYPEPSGEAQANSDFSPPHPCVKPPQDVFAVCGSSIESAPTESAPTGATTPALPYIHSDTLNHLRCGNPTIYNLGQRALSLGFASGKLTVCDMTSYLWSNTLKDPRSWAVVHTAISKGIRYLGVWTAGNAGYSLAKLSYVANRLLPDNQRLRVYCYGMSGEFPAELRAPLQRFRANVSLFTPTGGTRILRPHTALELLNARLPDGLQIPKENYWDVSDGWDGVALYMYRLLGRQLCVHLKPNFLVAPVGTGDLFFGLYLGRRDAVNRKLINETDCRLVAAVPQGKSVLSEYEEKNLKFPKHSPEQNHTPAVAPKLTTSYTPLLLVMYTAFHDHAVEVVEVSREDQTWAAQRLELAAEPSALISFGALKTVAKIHRGERTVQGSGSGSDFEEASVLVINTGCGVVGNVESDFLRGHLEQPIHV